MSSRFVLLLCCALGISGCASTPPTPEAESPAISSTTTTSITSTLAADAPLPAPAPKPEASKPAVKLSPVKRRQKSLVGATYVRRSALPRALGIGWKTVLPLTTGSRGGDDFFLTEKKGERRLVLASSQKFWLALYRYAVQAEQDVPTALPNVLPARCSSTAGADIDEFALIDSRERNAIIWLARREGRRIVVVDGKAASSHLCQIQMPRGEILSQSLLW